MARLRKNKVLALSISLAIAILFGIGCKASNSGAEINKKAPPAAIPSGWTKVDEKDAQFTFAVPPGFEVRSIPPSNIPMPGGSGEAKIMGSAVACEGKVDGQRIVISATSVSASESMAVKDVLVGFERSIQDAGKFTKDPVHSTLNTPFGEATVDTVVMSVDSKTVTTDSYFWVSGKEMFNVAISEFGKHDSKLSQMIATTFRAK